MRYDSENCDDEFVSAANEGEHAVEEPLADNGWPDLSVNQQAAFENDLPLWLQGTEGTTRQRLRIASWRFFHAEAVRSQRA